MKGFLARGHGPYPPVRRDLDVGPRSNSHSAQAL